MGAGNRVLWRFDAQAGSPPEQSDYRNVALGPQGAVSHFTVRPFIRT
jgi:hypothetical protein